jgi:hypothetical protein
MGNCRSPRLLSCAFEGFGDEFFGGGGERLVAGVNEIGERSYGWANRGVGGALAPTAVVVIDGFVAAEDEMGDVSEDGGATGRDTSCGDELIKGNEGVVDLLGELEVVALGDEVGGEVGGIIWRGQGHGVAGAKGRTRIDGWRAALATFGSAVLTTVYGWNCVRGLHSWVSFRV